MGPNPTDRGKRGTKRSVMTEGEGLPVALAVEGANRNDFKMLEQTLDALMIPRPTPTEEAPQRLCLDKGYDYAEVYELLKKKNYTPNVKRRGEEKKEKREEGKKARRWVVERAHSWMNRFRRVLIRWEIRLDTYLGMLHFACGLIVWKAILRHKEATQPPPSGVQ